MILATITEKRIKYELKNLKKTRMENIQVIQDENDKFTFYFLLKGIKKSDYDGGYYMGKIILPPDYPNSPVDYKMLTPSGRFTINSSICLTNSKYHKEQWSPSWNLENMTIGFISIFNDDSEHGISHIKDSPEKRKAFARDSINYNLTHYKNIFKCFDQFVNSDGTIKTDDELTKEHTEFMADKKKKKGTADEPSKTISVVVEDEDDSKCNKHDDSFASILGKKTVEKTTEEKSQQLSKSDIIKCKFDLIKNMPFEKFDLKLYDETYSLLTTSLTEL